MKKSKVTLFLVLISVVSLAAFTSASKTTQLYNNSLAKQLIGEWRNVYVKITLHHKTDPVFVMEADSSNWEEKLQIKPIRTHFMEDGTYYSEYRNVKDTLVKKPSGTWKLKRDSLFMTQQIPDKSIYKFHLKIIKDRATFTGVIDFDGEGIDNDEYFGIQKKFR